MLLIKSVRIFSVFVCYKHIAIRDEDFVAIMDGEGQAAQPSVGFNVSFMGNIEEYSPNIDWKQYVERLEIFFEVNNVPTDKQASRILTLMGSKMYGLLRSITAPRRPKELTHKEIVDTFTQHFEPKQIVIAERYKFHKAEQKQSESIRHYLAKLQRLAETCEFGGYRDEAIRDRFVCGLRNRAIQRKLLGEVELTLKLAVEKACAAELTDRETSALHGESLNRLEKALPECFRCGKKNHSSDKCFFPESKCHGCQNYGHIIRKCPERLDNKNSKKTSSKSKGRGDKRKKRNRAEFITFRQTVRLKVAAKARKKLRKQHGQCLRWLTRRENIKS